MKDSEMLYYTRPSRRWTDALPLGNGALGAMVYGTTDPERLALNLDTLWSGKPSYKENPKALNAFRELRQLVFEEGQIPTVNRRLEEEMQGYDSETYLPLGDLLLSEPNIPSEITDFSRALCLADAVASVHCKRGGADYSEEWFISAPAQVLVGKIHCEKPLDLALSLACPLEHSVFARNGFLILDGQCPGGMRGRRSGFPQQSDDPAEQGMLFRMAVKAVSDGNCCCECGTILLEHTTDAVVILAAEDSFNGFDKHPVLEGKPYKEPVLQRITDAFEKGYDALRAEHIADHRSFYDRVTLELGSADKAEEPTNERLNRFGEGEADPALYTLLFNYGRYLAISASRPGTQAMNLQGIWNHRLKAPWASNYTVNINTEMNYWPILPCGLTELHEPLEHMLRDISVAGRRVAREYYGADGFVCHHNSDLWRMCVPATGNPVWSFWYNGAGWMSRHLFDRYEYTLDTAYLRDTALPILKGCAEFYLSILTEDPDGYLVCAPSTSPENEYMIGEEEYSVSQTTTMTMAICREVLENTLKACTILGTENALCAKIEAVLPRLLPFRTGKDGRLLEWYREEVEEDIHHRHVSHLYALHPANLISAEKTPDLAEAARKTLETRGDDGTGWSLGWKINFWARLRDGNRALRLLDTQLRYVDTENVHYQRGGGTYANLFDAHPPFQIDGNFGAVSGIAEMLLQSLDGKIYLLPALPQKWATGSVKGLRAKGNVAVDLFWENGALKKVCLYGSGSTVTVRYGEKEKTLTVDGTVMLNGTLEIR